MATSNDVKEIPDHLKIKKGGLFRNCYICPWKEFHRPSPVSLAEWKFVTENNSNIPTDKKVTISMFDCTLVVVVFKHRDN